MIKTKYKSNNCGELNLDNLGQEVTLSGWASCVRDLGGIIFVELRDRTGLFQLRTHKLILKFIKLLKL